MIGTSLGIGVTTLVYQSRPNPLAPSVESASPEAVATTLPVAGSAEEPLKPVLSSVDPTDQRLSFRELRREAGRLALSDPEAALRVAMAIPGTDNREAFFGEVLRTWGETDGPGATAWTAANLAGEQRGDAFYYIADGWAESEPQAAAEWFAQNTSGVVLDDAAWEILESWGRQDPEAAVRWTETLDPYVKQTAMQGLAEGWAAVRPVAAKEAGLRMLAAGEPHAGEFLQSVASQWGGADPFAAADWGVTLPDERLRSVILEEVTDVWSRTDPRAAATWVETVADPGSRRFAEAGLAAGWGEHDPGAAVDWALEKGTGGAEVGPIVSDWVEIDPRGATRWIEEKPPGPGRDAALEAFTGAIIADEPQAAVAWAKQIDDPARRRAQLETLTARWIQADGATAVEALREMNLTPAN